MEEDEGDTLEKLFKSMKDWSRERMKDWLIEIIGEDEAMKPLIDELYKDKNVTNDELIEYFKNMLMGQPNDEEPPVVDDKKPDSKNKKSAETSKATQSNKPSSSQKKRRDSSSSSSSSDNLKPVKAGKKRKLVVSDDDDDTASDCTVDLSRSKQPKPSNEKKSEIRKAKVKSETKKQNIIIDSDDDDSVDFKPKKHSSKSVNKDKIDHKPLKSNKIDIKEDKTKSSKSVKSEKESSKAKSSIEGATGKDRRLDKDQLEKHSSKVSKDIKIKVEKSLPRPWLPSDLKAKYGSDKGDKPPIVKVEKSDRDKHKDKDRHRERHKSDKDEKKKSEREKEKASKVSVDKLDSEKGEKKKSEEKVPKVPVEKSDTHKEKKPPDKETEPKVLIETSIKKEIPPDKVDEADVTLLKEKHDKLPDHVPEEVSKLSPLIDLTEDHFVDEQPQKVIKDKADVTGDERAISELENHKTDQDPAKKKQDDEDCKIFKIIDGDLERRKHFDEERKNRDHFDKDKDRLDKNKVQLDREIDKDASKAKNKYDEPLKRKDEIKKERLKEPPASTHLGPTVRSRNSPMYLHPLYFRYRKKFRLRPVTVEMHDIRRQSLHWRSGDHVYRAQFAEERRKRKEQRKLEEKKEKYSERGTRILPFEKRPENAELYRKKSEIVREKPKVESFTEKQKRLMELHKKERDKEKEKKIKNISQEFKIPKNAKLAYQALQDSNITSFTPLAPAVKLSKTHFDKKRLVIPEKEKESWGMTPEEKRALERQSTKPAPPVQVEKKPADSGKVVEITIDDDLGDLGDFGIQDDDYHNTIDLEREEQDDDGGSFCYPDVAPPPANEIEVNDISRGVIKLMGKETEIQAPDDHASPAEVVIRKVAKWYRFSEMEPYYQACPSIPEHNEENFYTLMSMAVDDDDISVGNVSNPDDDDGLQDNNITSTTDPDLMDEYCGRALLDCKYRVQAGEGENCFAKIFNVRRGTNYDKLNFQANCNLCGDLITNKRHLAAHVRSSDHREKMTSTSLKLIGVETKLGSSKVGGTSPSETVTSKSSDANRRKKEKERNEKDKVDRNQNGKAGVPKEKDDKKKTEPGKIKRSGSGSSQTTLPPGVKKPEDPFRGRRRSRSRSRSPHRRHRRSRSRGHRSRSRSRSRPRTHRRSRSRSPRGGRHHRGRSRSPDRRRHSKDAVQDFLDRNDRATRRSPPPKAPAPSGIVRKQDHQEVFNEVLKLQATGKWTAQLESRWKLTEEEEQTLKKVFAQKRKLLEETPENHPTYADEWTKFWEKRYQELTDHGKDADNYDYAPEWKIYWGKLSEAFLEREMDMKLHEIRKKYGVDLETLRALSNAPTQVVVPPAPPIISGIPVGVPPPYFSGITGSVPIGTYPIATTVAHDPVTLQPVVMPPYVAYTAPHPVNVVPQTVVAPAVVAQPVDTLRTMGVDYTAKPMSISSSSAISAYSDRGANVAPKATIDSFKNTWETLTGQRIQQAVVEKAKSVASNASSNESQHYDYDGHDVCNLLRLMTSVEDALSFLAPKVQEYYKMAEKMELETPRKSFQLLKDVEFVQLLHSCRDKFYAILKANVSTSEVKTLNVLTFTLTVFLNSPSCQKIKPTVPAASPTTAAAVLPSSNSLNPLFSSNPSAATSFAGVKADSGSATRIIEPPKVYNNMVAAALADISMDKKIKMSKVISSSLIAQGNDRFSDPELRATLLRIMSPILNAAGQVSPGPSTSRRDNTGSVSSTEVGENAFNVNKFSRRGDPESPQPGDSGGAGLGLHLMPEIVARAVSPPKEKMYPTEPKGSTAVSSFFPNAYRGSGGGGRRDYMGNPIPVDQIDSHYEATPTQKGNDLYERLHSRLATVTGDEGARQSDGECYGKNSAFYSDKIEEFDKDFCNIVDPEVHYGQRGINTQDSPEDGQLFNRLTNEVQERKRDDDSPPNQSNTGSHLPPGILNLIQKERRKTTEDPSGSASADKAREQKATFAAVPKRPTGSVVSISSSTKGRRRRMKKSGKRDQDNRKKKKYEKQPSRHESSGKDHKQERRRKGKKKEKCRPLSPNPRLHHERSSSYMDCIDQEEQNQNSPTPRRVAPSRDAGSTASSQGSSKRHHRGHKRKSSKNRQDSLNSKVPGVSQSFWQPQGSVVSSDECFEESKSDLSTVIPRPGSVHKRRDSLKSHSSRRRKSTNNDTEEGEIVSSSEWNDQSSISSVSNLSWQRQ